MDFNPQFKAAINSHTRTKNLGSELKKAREKKVNGDVDVAPTIHTF